MYKHLLALAAASASAATTYSGAWIRVTVAGPTCNALDFGAVGDGVADDTAAVQRAITACTPSGTTLLPAPHVFLTRALELKDARGAALVIDGTLRFSNASADWKGATHCLTLSSGASIALAGAGTVDGQGAAWWPDRAAPRPGLFYATNVNELLIANLTFIDSPNHSLEVYAGNTEIVNATIRAPASTAPLPSHNTDGIDLHGDYFYVHDSTISVGDDNVAIHSSHVLVEDCAFGDGHGASIGSIAGATALENITVRGVAFDGTTSGVRIKVDSKGATGYIRDVTYANLTMRGVGQTVGVCFFYDVDGDCNWPGVAPPATTTLALNVTIADIASDSAAVAGQLTCAASATCAGVVVRNVVHTGAAPKPWACKNAHARVGPGNVPALGAECSA